MSEPDRKERDGEVGPERGSLQMKGNVEFQFLQSPKQKDHLCRPVEMLRELLDAGELSHFLEVMMRDPAPDAVDGDCHEVASALMIDLMVAERAKGWHRVKGYQPEAGGSGSKRSHSWLECDGWAIDASDKRRSLSKHGELPIIVGEAARYRKHFKLKVTKRRDARQMRKRLIKDARRLGRGRR